ncbi:MULTISPECIES: chaperone modulator CbpM [Algoriphagus]|uniref:MerR HTH family regulatory protein n=1 Tax=Algoriphagus zhangzhouensis TaxID=1073327 RepID=A0A1M7ZAS5_9BACT|nr:MULTISPECIES: chaperone modulator CbpM [Algoriphagus]TDY47026.1 MerR-like DNA binding protein [Algoriphagus zhangzhouensis]SHO62015.1 MerR HTH family regulatory protein [Algoriphagus zhangzhouensis]
METQFISISTICVNYHIESSFLMDLSNIGLIQIEIIEQEQYIHHDQIADLEKMIRLHDELDLNLEGIDVVFNLLAKQRELQKELTTLRNRLRLYE